MKYTILGFQDFLGRKVSSATRQTCFSRCAIKYWMVAACFFTFQFHSVAQLHTQVVGDSVRIHSNNATGELILENATKDLNGFLFNKGNGRTEFRRGIVGIDDTTFLIGADTLHMTSPMKWGAINGLTRTGDNVKLGGSLSEFTTLNQKNKHLTILFSDNFYTSAPNGGLTLSGVKTESNSYDNIYVQAFNRPASNSYSGTSVYTETFWQPSTAVTEGLFTNFLSTHKSSQPNLDMSGITLCDFRTLTYANASNQNYGTRYHFYVGGSVNAVTVKNVGLYVSPLKNATTTHAYAIQTVGADDSVFHAGPVRLTKYKNSTADSLLTTDANGNLKLVSGQSLTAASLPKLTTTERDAIQSSSLYAGFLVYNTDVNAYQFFSGSSWSTLSAQYANQSTLDFPSTASGTSSDTTITVTGAVDGDAVSLGVPNSAMTANSSFSAWVSGSNTVTIRFNNYSGAAIDPTSGVFKVKVLK